MLAIKHTNRMPIVVQANNEHPNKIPRHNLVSSMGSYVEQETIYIL